MIKKLKDLFKRKPNYEKLYLIAKEDARKWEFKYNALSRKVKELVEGVK